MIKNRYEPLGKIGFGAFGETFQAIDKQTDEIVAVKIMKHGVKVLSRSREDLKESIQREIGLLQSLKVPECHPNLLCLVDYQIFDNFSIVVTEFIEGDTLQKLTYESDFGVFSEKSNDEQLFGFFNLVNHLSNALSFLHKYGIAHRDIKPDNVMVSRDRKNVKLIDYGLSCLTRNFESPNEDISKTELECPADYIESIFFRYTSPELIMLKNFTKIDLVNIKNFDDIFIQNDMWSLGILLYYICHKRLPFDINIKSPRLLWYLFTTNQLEKSSTGYKSVDNLINNSLLRLNPQNRMTSDKLLKYSDRNIRRIKSRCNKNNLDCVDMKHIFEKKTAVNSQPPITLSGYEDESELQEDTRIAQKRELSGYTGAEYWESGDKGENDENGYEGVLDYLGISQTGGTKRFSPLKDRFKRWKKDKQKQTADRQCLIGYKLKEVLGQGMFGKVARVCFKDNCEYAVKIIPKQKINPDEITITKKLWDNYRVGPRFHDAWDCNDQFYVVTDLWDGELPQDACLSDKLLEKLCQQVKRLHRGGFVHGDIYEKNILIKRDNDGEIVDVTLADFGTVVDWDSVKDLKEPDDIPKLKTELKVRALFKEYMRQAATDVALKKFLEYHGITEKDVVSNPMLVDLGIIWKLHKICGKEDAFYTCFPDVHRQSQTGGDDVEENKINFIFI